MKALKVIGGIVVVLVLIVAVLSFIAPTHTHVERSVTIDAPMELVWANVNNFESMEAWSPWKDRDPEQVTTIEGEDGTVGAVYTWKGNAEVGEGSQEITAIEEGKIVTHLHFLMPFEAEADASVVLEESDSGTVVTWNYDADAPRPMNVMGLMYDMDAMLGADYMVGLEKLENQVMEAKASRSEFNGFEIEITELVDRTYIGVRDTLSIDGDGFEAFYMENFPKTYKAVTKAELELAGQPSGLYFTWDEANNSTAMMAAIPVSPGSECEGFDKYDIGGKALMINHFGPYEKTGDAHMAMEAYMNWHELKMRGPAIEMYVNTPQDVADMSELHTVIYYPVE